MLIAITLSERFQRASALESITLSWKTTLSLKPKKIVFRTMRIGWASGVPPRWPLHRRINENKWKQHKTPNNGPKEHTRTHEDHFRGPLRSPSNQKLALRLRPTGSALFQWRRWKVEANPEYRSSVLVPSLILFLVLVLFLFCFFLSCFVQPPSNDKTWSGTSPSPFYVTFPPFLRTLRTGRKKRSFNFSFTLLARPFRWDVFFAT